MPTTVDQLEKKAEEARVQGNRQLFLDLHKEIERFKEAEVLKRHKACLESVKKEFPIGRYIEELHTTVTEIKDGCGTQRGWIDVYLSGYKSPLKPYEIRKKIIDAKQSVEVSRYFRSIKVSDRMKKVYIGSYIETLEKLADYMDLDLSSWEDIEEWNLDWLSEVRSNAENEAKKDGYTDEQAEEMGMKAEEEESNDLFEKYVSALTKTLNYLLELHNLELVDKGKRWYLAPKTTWKDVAQSVIETINGMGPFYYESVKSFKEVGPYKSYAEAVFSHLHWCKNAVEVYGYKSYKRFFEW